MNLTISRDGDFDSNCFLTDDIKEKIAKIIAGVSSEQDVTISQIKGDGSQRCFFRAWMENGKSFVLMFNPRQDSFGLKENISYVRIGNHLSKSVDVLPKIYAHSDDLSIVLLEDLGDLRLYDVFWSGQDVSEYYRKALENLVLFQTRGIKDFDPEWCCQTKSYNRQVMLEYECKYFLSAFLEGYLRMDSEDFNLESDFEYIISMAHMAPVCVLIHRDFQSRNIMVKDGKIKFVDWQGARPGPAGYDLASLLIDPYVNLEKSVREDLQSTYLELLRAESPNASEAFEETFPYFLLLRNLQILGAFSFLSKVKGKPFFEQFIPTAARSLYEMLKVLKKRNLQNLTELMDYVVEMYIPV